jgi:hypothetical protein
MHSTDYIPHTEASFVPWSSNFVSQITLKGTGWEVTNEEKTELSERQNVFMQKYNTAQNPETATQAAIQAKNDAKKEFIAYIRKIYRTRILNNDKVTNEDRDLLKVPIHDSTNTPVPPPHTVPLLIVDTSIHLQHKLKAVDTADGVKRSALPPKVRGLEIWRKIDGTPPVNDSDFTFFTLSSTTTHVESYPLENAGKTVWYRCRWTNARNQPGPWSEIVSAIIP